MIFIWMFPMSNTKMSTWTNTLAVATFRIDISKRYFSICQSIRTNWIAIEAEVLRSNEI